MKTIVIIGAGFSGTATAINLLRQADSPLRILLINKSGEMARGLAYGTSSPLHLLNVPAGNMSVLADDSGDFLRFCRGLLASVEAETFVPRKLYGEYLSTRLAEAELQAKPGVLLQRCQGEAQRIDQDSQGRFVELRSGERIYADHLVLAFGHFAPANPQGIDPVELAELYQQDPWAQDFSGDLDQAVLLVGSGLTALDVVTGLLQRGHRGKIYVLSRRGLLPLPHRQQQRSTTLALDHYVQSLRKAGPSVRSYMRLLRQSAATLKKQGVNWRDMIGALRPVTAELWQRLPLAEKQRFLRHVQPFWDTHRHRVAPGAYAMFNDALTEQQLVSMAARIVSVKRVEDQLEVQVRLRATQQQQTLHVARVINCTGPTSNLLRVKDGLIQQLCAEQLLKPDRLGLGLAVADNLAVLTPADTAVPWLSYVGPMLKGQYWEATAVPELRQYAAQLARRLVSELEAKALQAPWPLAR